MPAFTMSRYLAEDRQKTISVGLFQNIGYLYFMGRQARPDHYMRPDYSHKIFGDKRLHRFFFQKALARAIASA
jgi:hypothetical protein